ncbi:PREDICTED: uncharacterized protein LOC109236053 [Nicotiana attenuata]|uniref:uncharacterized protein LOC109236053 n=1 Tax=Nicotiana attenuata TaxID=49451 RepID=UPI00090587D0|nr:PREDICTED: uncharacterized protein LOC109236053 [Nicotiana attenuata]
MNTLEDKAARQDQEFQAEREQCYRLMAEMEKEIKLLQDHHFHDSQVLEARNQQISRLLQEKGQIRERIRGIADYIAMKCQADERMGRTTFFATELIERVQSLFDEVNTVEIREGSGDEEVHFVRPNGCDSGKNWVSTNVRASHGGKDVLEDLLAGVDEDIDLDTPAKKMYDRAFHRLQDEVSCCGKELEVLTSALKESEASSARKEEELSGLRARLEGACQEKVGLIEQGEVVAKDAEVLELRGQHEAVASERDLLRTELSSTRDLLQSAKKEVVALVAAKSAAKADASSYKKDAATANERAREISKKVGQKLTRATAHTSSKARRQALDEASAKGVDLSAEIEEARDLEEESAFSATSDEGSVDDPESSSDEE